MLESIEKHLQPFEPDSDKKNFNYLQSVLIDNKQIVISDNIGNIKQRHESELTHTETHCAYKKPTVTIDVN